MVASRRWRESRGLAAWLHRAGTRGRTIDRRLDDGEEVAARDPHRAAANISGDGGHDQPASPATEEVKHSPPTSCYIIGKTYRHWLRIIGTQAHRVKLINRCNTQENIFSTVDIMLAYSVWGYRTHPLLQKKQENFLNFKVKLVVNMRKINQMLCILISESLMDSQSQSASIFMKEACP